MGGGGGIDLQLLIRFSFLFGRGGGIGGGIGGGNVSWFSTRCGKVWAMEVGVGNAAPILPLVLAAGSAYMGSRDGDAQYGSPGGGLPAQTSR